MTALFDTASVHRAVERPQEPIPLDGGFSLPGIHPWELGGKGMALTGPAFAPMRLRMGHPVQHFIGGCVCCLTCIAIARSHGGKQRDEHQRITLRGRKQGAEACNLGAEHQLELLWRQISDQLVRQHTGPVNRQEGNSPAGLILHQNRDTIVRLNAAFHQLPAELAYTVERDIANAERRNSEQVSEFLIDSFRLADRSGTEGRRLTAEEVLNRGSDRVQHQLADQLVMRARIMTTIGEVYGSLGIYDKAQSLLSRALQDSPSAQTLSALGKVAGARGDLPGAEDWYRKALAAEHRPSERATIQADLADALVVAGKSPEAEGFLNESLLTRREMSGPESATVADVLFRLGRLKHFNMQLKDAETLIRQSLQMRLRILGPENPESAETTAALAQVLGMLGKASEAERLQLQALSVHRKLYGPAHVIVAEDLDVLSSLLYDAGQYARAAAMTRESLKLYEAAQGPNGSDVANVMIHLGNTLERLGMMADAEKNLRAGLAIHEKLLGPDHPLTVGAEHSLANTLRLAGKYEEAEKLETRIVRIQREKDPHNPVLAYYVALTASLKRARGDFAGADLDFAESVATLKKTYGEKHLTYGRSVASWAMNRTSMGDTKGAEVPLRHAVDIARQADHSNPSDVSFAMVGLAQNLLLQGKAAEAEPLARQAYETRRSTLPAGDQRFALAESVLGGCLAALHRSDEARPLLTESHRNLLTYRKDRSLAPELRRLSDFARSGPYGESR